MAAGASLGIVILSEDAPKRRASEPKDLLFYPLTTIH
jgi:hypothetical protein